MKLPNFSATFYRLTTFLLGLKGVHRIIGDRFTVINPSNFVGSLQLYVGIVNQSGFYYKRPLVVGKSFEGDIASHGLHEFAA